MHLLHRFSTLTVASCAALAIAVACDGSSAPGSAGIGASGSGSEGGEGGADNSAGDSVPVALAFSSTATVRLTPKQTRVLTVVTTPPGSFHVRFGLIGAPADAVLNANEVPTGADGTAQVTLTASSTQSSFSVRASVSGKNQKGVQTQLGVQVSALGYTTLSVKPSYSGPRTVTQWTASLHQATQCSALRGSPPPDGVRVTVGNFGAPLTIDDVPIGVNLAVTLRAGHYIGGCADVAALSEGDGNQVLVYAADRPVNFDDTILDLSFGPSDARPAFSKLMKVGQAAVAAGLVGAAANDVASLLEAMYTATPLANRVDFSAARTAQHWDAALAAAFGTGAATRLRDPVDRWISAGLSSFNAPNTFIGRLSPNADGARFELLTVAKYPAAAAGFSSSAQSTWSADASDTLLLGTELSWVPSRLMTALALSPALAEFPSATTAQAALVQSVDCALVAKTLLAHGVSPGAALYSSCDESCAVTACTAAIDTLWSTASDASGTTLAVLGVTAAGTVLVGDAAEVVSLHGSWVGDLTQGENTASTSGALSAVGSSN
ncbi:MAG: hypothetical protein ABI488_04570 [Polyangiaceae bacterium]